MAPAIDVKSLSRITDVIRLRWRFRPSPPLTFARLGTHELPARFPVWLDSKGLVAFDFPLGRREGLSTSVEISTVSAGPIWTPSAPCRRLPPRLACRAGGSSRP